MSERSIEIFKMSQAAWDKFDYFVCGSSGALFAYIAQTYVPQKLALWYPLLEPLALLLLAGSFVVGLLRIESCGHLGTLNFKLLHAGECAGELTKFLASPPADDRLINLSDGEVYNLQQIP